MIVNHRAGEYVAAAMNKQYRYAFNFFTPVVATAVGAVASFPLWNGFAVVGAGAGVLFTYGVNLKGRKHRVHEYELKKPTKLTEQWILELQDIYFRMPAEHRAPVEGLLDGAYEQIERGNVDAVNPRLEKARALQRAVVRMNELLDTGEDIKAVDTHVRVMQKAIEA